MAVQAAVILQCQRIDGQVTRGKIALQRIVPQRHVFPAAPETDPDAPSHDPRLPVLRGKVLPASGKGEIQIFGTASQQQIPHGATHKKDVHMSALRHC